MLVHHETGAIDEPSGGAMLVYTWLRTHLPEGMVLPEMFVDDGLRDKMYVAAFPPKRKSVPAFSTRLGVWELIGGWKAAPPMELSPDEVVEGAVKANNRVTGRSIARWYFELESGDSLAREGASAVLAYMARYPRERRFRAAAAISLNRLRNRGDPTYPAELVNLVVDVLRGKAGAPSDRIRAAFRGAAKYALTDRGMTDKEAAAKISRAFPVTGTGTGNAGIAKAYPRKHRHDREYLS